MNLWNIRGLKNSLIEGPLPENQTIKYLLTCIFLWSTVKVSPLLQVQDSWQTILDIASILIALIGTYYCFKINGGPNGLFFLQRFFPIGFVVAARIAVMFFFPIFVAVLILENLIEQIPLTTTWYDVVLSLSYRIVIFWRISIHISQVAKSTKYSSSASTLN